VKQAQDQLFDLLPQWDVLYEMANEPTKRRINRSFFRKLLIDGGEVVEGEMDAPEPSAARRYFRRPEAALGLRTRSLTPAWRRTLDPPLIFVAAGSSHDALVELTGHYSNILMELGSLLESAH
jgi:hypothetical protein